VSRIGGPGPFCTKLVPKFAGICHETHIPVERSYSQRAAPPPLNNAVTAVGAAVACQ
jgi:hypothetical protein